MKGREGEGGGGKHWGGMNEEQVADTKERWDARSVSGNASLPLSSSCVLGDAYE